MQKIKSLVEFSGVPKGTTGKAVFDNECGDWVVTWDLERSKPLVDWFTPNEFERFLEKIN